MRTIHRMHVENLDLNLLRVLDAVLREQNVTRAAVALKLSQPAASHALARLRRTLGDPLLVKRGRHMELTREAERLRPVVDRIMRMINNELVPSSFDPSTSDISLTVAMPEFLVGLLLNQVVRALRHEAPRVQLEMVSFREQLMDRRKLGYLDAAVLQSDWVPQGFKSHHLFDIRWVGLAAEGNPNVDGPLEIEDLRAMSHVVIEGSEVGVAMARALHTRDWVRGSTIRVATSQVIPALIAETDLVSVGPSWLRAPGLRTFPLPIELPHTGYELAWSPRMDTNPASMWLRENIIRVAELHCQRDGEPLGTARP